MMVSQLIETERSHRFPGKSHTIDNITLHGTIHFRRSKADRLATQTFDQFADNHRRAAKHQPIKIFWLSDHLSFGVQMTRTMGKHEQYMRLIIFTRNLSLIVK
eukprot:TRINITY_DN91649_c0_g1_i1.p1 TRINITY_DN91649_c0_g1~~TRINITY_DN91649_c0_g1_i1.p1  ORF type:complete len:103 (+),score=8.37 TRINITY_DN91649_c0_g1_i1:33-341(+)